VGPPPATYAWRGVLDHCDAVQAAGKVPIDVQKVPADYLSLTGHVAASLPRHPLMTANENLGSPSRRYVRRKAPFVFRPARHLPLITCHCPYRRPPGAQPARRFLFFSLPLITRHLSLNYLCRSSSGWDAPQNWPANSCPAMTLKSVHCGMNWRKASLVFVGLADH